MASKVKKTNKPAVVDKLQVIDHPTLERDTRSNAILNRSQSSYRNARSRKLVHHQRTTEIQSLKDEVEVLKSMMREFMDNRPQNS